MAVTFDEARSLILKKVIPLETEDRPLLDALGLALQHDTVASRDMPLWDNSAMDGFAVRAEDCLPGSSLIVTGCILAGGRPEPVVEGGCAVKIMTGAPMPPGANAVVPFEIVEDMGDKITIQDQVRKGDHTRIKGEDISAGAKVLSAGTVLHPEEISLLASLGYDSVVVHRQVRVAIISTGDELVEPGKSLVEGQIADSNSLALGAAVKEAGAVPELLGIAADNHASLLNAFSRAAGADVLVTSAGVSAGERDLVREVLCDLGMQEVFWKILIKPGFPAAFGLLDGKPVFSLPGNPVSALMVFAQFVRPALLKMMGHRRLLQPVLRASLKEPFRKKPGRLNLMRVRLCQEGLQLVAYNAGDQKSGILSTSVHANAVAFLPADRKEFAVGDEVEVQLLGNFSSEPI